MNKVKLVLLSAFFMSCSGATTYIEKSNRDWKDNAAPEESDLIYKVFLIGDAGAPSLDVQEPTLKFFQSQLESAGENSAAIFLGDNIYTKGLPDSTDPERPFYEARIIEQLKTVKNYQGRVIFVPGNHDWEDGGRDGLNAVRREEAYIEKYLDRGNTFLPDDGFPGPVEVKLMDKDEDERLERDIRFVALDTQWWLHKFEKPYGDTGEYELGDAGDVITELQDIVRDRKNDFLIVGAHHPMESKDKHGGYFPLKTHFTAPFFGSFYMLYRKIFGYPQDLANRDYKAMTNYFRETFEEKTDVFYVSGHAHGLQYEKYVYAKRYTQHYITSGAGSKTSYIADGRGTEFSHESNGFMTLNIYADGSVWLEAWEPVGDGSSGNLLYRSEIKGPYGNVLEEEIKDIPDFDYSDSTVVIAPNKEYATAGGFKKGLLGENNRNLWGIESEFPVFDVSEIEGGLTPTRSGGRGQSNTLHLDGKNGEEYVLRSLDKVAGKVWDDHLRNSYALEIAQEQFSMLDPYAAIIVAELAKYAGVNHVKPTIYYVPDDPRLGRYAEEMAGKLALFERKPDGDMSDVFSVGNRQEVISSLDMKRKLDGDTDHRVDQHMFAKFRLFDMLIGDWDRHSDQWRWAAVEPEDRKGKIYEPIPRDRDVALMKMDGLAFSIARIGPLFQYQNTAESYGNFKGLNYNSLGITRPFTNKLTREDWIRHAKDLALSLTDAAIDSAVKAYPKEVYEAHGEKIAGILKVRRDQLEEKASLFYDLISSVVTIPASNKRELFKIDVIDKNRISVQVFKLSGKGEVREQYYDRTFLFPETREVRLYGLGGDDRFEVYGEEQNKTRIRIIGGPGKDVIREMDPDVRRKMLVYDTKDDNEISVGKGTRLRLSSDDFVNFSDYEHDYLWNSTLAGFYFNYNNADWVYIGGGPKFVKHSFRRKPAQMHYIRGNLAPTTVSANLKYTGNWYQVSKGLNINTQMDALLPGSYRYFYGLGNETKEETRTSINYYRAKLSQFIGNTKGILNLNEVLYLSGGTGFEYTKVRDVTGENNVLNNPQAGINPNVFEDQLYATALVGFKINTIDDAGNPMRGVQLNLESKTLIGLNDYSTNHTNISGTFKYYLTARSRKQITFAQRVGVEHLIGSFPFYNSNSVGGISNLRGYHPRRFSGRTAMYTNGELRLELLNFYDYYLGGRLGILGFQDTGRVWTDGEDSEKIHYGYGGGVWFDIFDSLIVNFMYGKSLDDYSIEVRLGFMF